MRVHVRVPASTSNLGGGFDCIGVAVDRWLHVTAALECAGPEALRVERRGTLAALDIDPAEDLIVAGFRSACARAAAVIPAGVMLRARSTIPVARGLGSSAAAIVAGAAAARALLGLALDDAALLDLAAGIEGHPDNAAPALLGGARLALSTPSGTLAVPLAVHPAIRLVFAVPEFRVDTHRAREALPATVPHADACRATASAAALVRGLESGDRALLAAGVDGVLHVPYRARLVPGLDAVVRAARDAGAAGATLSGSGSAIVAIALADDAERVAAAMAAAWRRRGAECSTFVSAPCATGTRTWGAAPANAGTPRTEHPVALSA